MEEANGTKYIVNVLPGEECNPEFAPDQEMAEGIAVDGFVLIGFKGRKPCFESMMGVSTADLSRWLRGQERGAMLIRAACAIAEGEIRAKEILEKQEEGGGITITGSLPKISDDILRKILGKGE